MFPQVLVLVPLMLLDAKEPTIDYRGKTITHSRFKKIAKQVTVKQVNDPGRLLGLAGQIEGSIGEIDGDNWSLNVADRTGNSTCPVIVSKLKATQFKEQQVVHVWGILTKDGLEAEIVELIPPGLQWAYKLRDPGPVRGGTQQAFHVDCVVENGDQHLSRVLVAVRLFQVSSPNDFTEEVKLVDLEPGEQRNFTVSYRLYNFEYIGATSVPKVEFRVLDYEL